MTEQQQIAATILAQLGGQRFKAMTGAHGFTTGEAGQGRGGLSFRIPSRNRIRAAAVRITLTARDLYDVEFLAIRNFHVRSVASHAGLYADQLRPIFEQETGLATSLGSK